MTRAAPILVCFAVKEEAAPFRRLAGSAQDVRILLTGMGRRNAESAVAVALAEQRPQVVLSAGFAGALVPELARGAVIFMAEKQSGLEARLLAVGGRPVRFHCAERVAATAEEKRALRAATGADAVEMESGFIHLQCEERGIPSATVRVILDTVNEDLVLDFNRLMTPNQKIDGRKLALAIIRSPWKIPGLLRFQKQSAMAARSLGETLARLVAR